MLFRSHLFLGGYSSGLYGQNYQGMYGTNINNANNALNAWLTTGKQMSSDISSIAGGAGFCWTAREIFGPWDPQWLEFRDWVLERSPAKFRAWYCSVQNDSVIPKEDRQNHGGQNWARRLRHASDSTRAAVKAWMLRRLVHQPSTINHQPSHG